MRQLLIWMRVCDVKNDEWRMTWQCQYKWRKLQIFWIFSVVDLSFDIKTRAIKPIFVNYFDDTHLLILICLFLCLFFSFFFFFISCVCWYFGIEQIILSWHGNEASLFCQPELLRLHPIHVCILLMVIHCKSQKLFRKTPGIMYAR